MLNPAELVGFQAYHIAVYTLNTRSSSLDTGPFPARRQRGGLALYSPCRAYGGDNENDPVTYKDNARRAALRGGKAQLWSVHSAGYVLGTPGEKRLQLDEK